MPIFEKKFCAYCGNNIDCGCHHQEKYEEKLFNEYSGEPLEEDTDKEINIDNVENRCCSYKR